MHKTKGLSRHAALDELRLRVNVALLPYAETT